MAKIIAERSGNLNGHTRGHVKRVLTKSTNHPHGIKVMLAESNQVGRVKAILYADE